MNENSKIIEQFNKGARNFNDWSVTQDEKSIKALADFCELSKSDIVLDIACGTGAFSLLAARYADNVKGIDISKGMINIAKENAKKRELDNVHFYCQNVEDIDVDNQLFSLVISRSAFHHMKRYKNVFLQMVRCCKTDGRICIQDIISYDNKKLDNYFEEMEQLIDKSHYRSYTKREFFNLYKENNIKVLGLFESESNMDFYDYVEHTMQNDISRKNIDKLLMKGLDDEEIASCLVEKNGRILWKRKVCTIIGSKK
ncbi:class I SAM-dependent methyltransferase [Vallitalea guaymasensis]|uniref:class I SAM-dependent methyltransferase n=1 Tax=Vallitalea guaymasensis TaxID=1185412 RepID=UPI000DE33B2C|nr:class I SAM-dependent methyltransferase [Vallitalea guaymasensis]